MIIQIRGTSGSGKTWAMREVMSRLGSWEKVYRNGRRRPLYYRLVSPQWNLGDGPIDFRCVVLGSYEATCGGCDGVGAAPAIYDLIKQVEEGDGRIPILTEGLLWSEDTRWTLALASEGWDVRALFLTTPVERCLEQIRSRRNEAGNDKPLNEYNTRNRVGVIERARVKLDGLGVYARRCSADQAPGIVLRWLEEKS